MLIRKGCVFLIRIKRQLPPSKKQKKSSIFLCSRTYSSKVDAIAVIEAEKTWYKNRMRVTREGAKETYKCKHKECKKKCFLLFHPESNEVSLWFNTQEHIYHTEL